MKKKKVHHDVQTVAEKKFWQTFSAKNVIKWYEYQMAPAEATETTESSGGAFVAEPRENLEDEVSRIMSAFQNSKQDSVDSLLREMGGSSDPVTETPAPEPAAATPAADAGTGELNMDGVDPEMVARIMDSFKTAKQDSVDSLFAAAEAEAAPVTQETEEAPASEMTMDASAEESRPGSADESEQEILANIASHSQQNQIDALFSNR
ncbi:MAG: hypothetical protein K5641_08810 [Lachnospiraceae bacterium]|nr:hypothetical protein [Lachnospiraceae bacterium]